MSLGKRFIAFCNENVVMISGIAIIIGVHWSWYRIQNVPTFVDPSEKKDLPIILAAKHLKQKAVDKYHELTSGDPKKQ